MVYLRAIARMRTCLWDELLPYHEVKEVLFALSGRLEADLARQLHVSLEAQGAIRREKCRVYCALSKARTNFPMIISTVLPDHFRWRWFWFVFPHVSVSLLLTPS